MIGEVVFCEKKKLLKVADVECWNCEYNIINGGVCYPWVKRSVKSIW